MEYPIRLKGFETQRIIVDTGNLIRPPRILVNGKPAEPGAKRGWFLLKGARGARVDARFRMTNPFDPIPQLFIDGDQVEYAPPLPWYAWVWAAIPLGLVVLGGVIGGVLGAVATYINVRLLRTAIRPILRILATAGVTLAAYGIASGLAILLAYLFAR